MTIGEGETYVVDGGINIGATVDASAPVAVYVVTGDLGATYEGRLRWGGDEEAFWSDYFNGVRDNNPWVDHVSSEQLTERRPIEVFGAALGDAGEDVFYLAE